MDAPGTLRNAANEDEAITISHRDYDDETVIAVDFGADVDAAVDVVGDTAIVVAGDRQFEFDVPDGATEITTNDGMLIIRKS
jgi:hypothetical protein